MQNIIFTIRDGPEDKPNRFFLARCISPADATRTFLMQEVDPQTYKPIEAGAIWAIHDKAMQISWHHSRAAQLIAVNESLSNLGGAAPVPRPVGEPPSTVLPCGTGLSQQ